MSKQTTETGNIMIKRKDVNIGDHVIENDPDKYTPNPFKGEVTAITGTGRGDYDYCATIRLDEESLANPYYKMISEKGHINAFGFGIDRIKK